MPLTIQLSRKIDYISKCLLIVAMLLSGACDSQPDIEIIRAISLLPRQTDYTRDFEEWLKQVNKKGDGKFKIIFVGGPEAIPTFEQADAVRNGVVHMVFGPATYYMGLLPEVEAMFASPYTPLRTRKNGGTALMDSIHQEKLGVKYLARSLFIEFHLFTREQPALNDVGIPDLSSQLIRGGPVWRDFITSLGANYVNVAGPDVYMALERNMIQGIGWPIIGLEDASWSQHLNYRIDPGVFSSDVGLIFNKEKWDGLSALTRETLQSAAIEYESESYERFQKLTRKLDKRMRENGMRVITLEEEGMKKYRRLANKVIWERLQERSPKYYAALRDKFFQPETARSND
ncbi:MAG: C4-dicarboxylate ABC transporter substrate-binding protein [Gammaproteobacteria bacterium]|nr:C4-dicarboxylate ABC transporter substrate-binding protein [Gammaproteobacteria bacterium]